MTIIGCAPVGQWLRLWGLDGLDNTFHWTRVLATRLLGRPKMARGDDDFIILQCRDDGIRWAVEDWYSASTIASDVANLVEVSLTTGVAPRPHQLVAWLAFPQSSTCAPEAWLEEAVRR